MTLQEFSEEFMKIHAVPNLTFTARQRYEGALRLHILPKLGMRRLCDLRRFDIEKFKAELGESKSAHTVFTILKTVLYKAVRWERLRGNPAQYVEAPPKPKPRQECWSKQEIERFLLFAKRTPRLPLYLIALNTGLREGEIFGLQWDAIDFEKNWIHVCRSFCQKTQLIREQTKTKREWHIPMNAVLRRVLQELKLRSKDSRVLCAEDLGMKGMHHVARVFRRDAVKAGVNPITFHGLRHTYATLFANEGGELFKLSRKLGHTKSTMTERYAHYSPSFQQDAEVVSVDVPSLAKVIPIRQI